ncbi:hypothetical protein [Nocardia sp. NPDC127526]|uniref:hypothetical protein n=1 Tax=Nocardia sp. NPDC127526 TaxID=3345393 RepID=UPI00363B30DE
MSYTLKRKVLAATMVAGASLSVLSLPVAANAAPGNGGCYGGTITSASSNPFARVLSGSFNNCTIPLMPGVSAGTIQAEYRGDPGQQFFGLTDQPADGVITWSNGEQSRIAGTVGARVNIFAFQTHDIFDIVSGAGAGRKVTITSVPIDSQSPIAARSVISVNVA